MAVLDVSDDDFRARRDDDPITAGDGNIAQLAIEVRQFGKGDGAKNLVLLGIGESETIK